MGVVKGAIKDAIFTAMWVFSGPFMGFFTSIIAASIGVPLKSTAALFITTNVAAVLILTFTLISRAIGGASFNPATSLSFYAAGLKPDLSLISMAVRFPAQAAGGVAGAKAIMQLMPKQYIRGGPSLKVDLHKGAVAEGVLTFGFCLILLLVMIKGPKNLVLKVWLRSVLVVGLVVAGANYTGPSMNPANAYGWAYVNNWHNSWELFYVYWFSPFIGSILAASVFRFLFYSAVKEKKA